MRTIQDQLREKGLSASLANTGTSANTSTKKKSEEQLTDREWVEIMGSNRDTFRRAKGGAIRRNL